MPTTTHVFVPRSRLFSAIAAPELLYKVNDLLEAGAQHLVVDMRHVLFMDNSGLGALMITLNRTQKASCRLSLCSLCGQARMLFEAAHVEQLFEVFPSLNMLNQTLPEGACQLITIGKPD